MMNNLIYTKLLSKPIWISNPEGTQNIIYGLVQHCSDSIAYALKAEWRIYASVN